MTDADFQDKGLIVAGGTVGIGPALVMEAARRRARVVFCDGPGSENAAAEILTAVHAEKPDGQVFFVPASLSDEMGVDRLFDLALEKIPTFDILINNMSNISGPEPKSLIETLLVDWRQVLAVTLRRSFLLTRRGIEEFLGQGAGGRILHIVYTNKDETMVPAICAATQSALNSLVRSITKEYGPRGIAINLLVVRANGEPIRQPLAISNSQRTSKFSKEQFPVEVNDPLLETALFLASSQASFVNGELLEVSLRNEK